MKFYNSLISLLILFISLFPSASAFGDQWNNPNLDMVSENASQVMFNLTLGDIQLEDFPVDGKIYQSFNLPGIFIPADKGLPNFPAFSRTIAIPRGANVEVQLIDPKIVQYPEVLPLPAPEIPAEIDDQQLEYIEDESVYQSNQVYPENIVRISEPWEIRGVQVVTIGVIPFQWDPLTHELKVYTDLRITVNFNGGNGRFSDPRLRSRFWDQILNQIVVNYSSLEPMDYSNRLRQAQEGGRDNAEFVIIVPDDPDFIQWADSIKQFRTEEGVITEVFTLTDIGGNNASTIEAWVNNAYNNWTIPPDAVLLLSDYESSGEAYGITSTRLSHPYSGTYVSDNIYADVTGDYLPEIVFARICAQDYSELEDMITKDFNYERNPPTSSYFYSHPTSACGWQTERWFQLAAEVVRGYWYNVLGKTPVRVYAIYSGSPSVGGAWSTAPNTSTVVNYFHNLGYIPTTVPSGINWYGTTQDMIDAVDYGTFIIQHRDHGNEYGWGEPDFNRTDLLSLNNYSNNEWPFVYSTNCLTGRYDYSQETFSERFHRLGGRGAVGVNCASQVSYSFVNDTYIWGNYDFMWPDFDPGYGDRHDSTDARPAFAMTFAKYYLRDSSWPYNSSSKVITYNLFHHFGDPYMRIYTEVPQTMSITHPDTINAGATTIPINAPNWSYIGLSVNGEIIGRGPGNGSTQDISIDPQTAGTQIKLVVTRQDYYRYESIIYVVDPVTSTDVCINEFAPKGTEWIELYNYGTSSVDLTGWIIYSPSDDTVQLSGTINASDHAYFTGFSGVFDNSGDQVFLIASNGDTLDQVAYGNQGGAPLAITNWSVGRITDGYNTGDYARDFNVDGTPTPNSSNDIHPAPLDPVVVINEIDPYPTSGPDSVELYNMSDTVVDISGWILSDGDYVGTLGSHQIQPYSFVVVDEDEFGFDFSSTDVCYLFLADTTRYDQLGYDGEYNNYSFQKIPNGSAPHDGYDWTSSGGGSTLFDTAATWNHYNGDYGISFTSPGGGEVWEYLETHQVSWNSPVINIFDLYYSTDDGSSWTELDDNVTGNSYQWDIPNTPSDQCRMRIIYPSDLAVREISNQFTITTDTIAPSVPSLVAPSSGELFDYTNIFFDWTEASFDNLTAGQSQLRAEVRYIIEIDNQTNFVSPVYTDSLDSTEINVNLSENVFYYWRVRAFDLAGNIGNWSSYDSFGVDDSPPAQVSLISPADDAYLNSSSVNCFWHSATDNISWVDHYQTQISTNSSFTSVVADTLTSDTSFNINLGDDEYFWRVRAYDAVGNEGSWSAIFSFEVDTDAPSVPSMVMPVNGYISGDSTVDFQWTQASFDPAGLNDDQGFVSSERWDISGSNSRFEPLAAPVSYIVEIDTNSNFNSPLIIDSLSSLNSQYSFSELNGNYYYWQVCAYDGAGNQGNFSSVDSFALDLTSPAIDSTTLWTDTVYTGPFDINTKITDQYGLDTAYILWKVNSDTDWTVAELSAGSNHWFNGQIPSVNTGDTVKYYIMAWDLADPVNYGYDPAGAPSTFYSFLVGDLGAEEMITKPDNFRFYFSSPSRNSIIFNLEVPQVTQVNLTVFDISGREVYQPISGMLNPSVYQVEFAPPVKGVFFYRLESKFQNSSGKFMIF
ncbi:MAG: C25 family cysteine peptidase [bacterium]